MANSIGEILGDGLDVPNSPLGPALTGQPQPQQAVPPEVAKNPQFQSIYEWVKKPENMLTAVVLAGALAQDRRRGQSTLDAVAERGLGALAFRGEMRRLNQKDVDDAAKAKSEADYRKGQIDVATDRNRIDREDIEARSKDTITRETAETGRAGMADATARYIAEMERDSRIRAAQIGASAGADPEQDAFMTTKDIIDIQKLAAENQVPFEEAMMQFARVRAMTDPRYAGWLKITEAPPVAAPASPKAEGKKKTAPPKKDYKTVTQSAPAVGLPNPLLGQSVGTGPHEAPPTARPYDPKYLYPGK